MPKIAINGPGRIGRAALKTLHEVKGVEVAAVNDLLREEAVGAWYRGVLGIAEEPLASADIIGGPRASAIDTGLTRVVDGTLVKVMSRYDNEWGFTHQMVHEAPSVLGVGHTL